MCNIGNGLLLNNTAPNPVPRQDNEFDCALFLCLYAYAFLYLLDHDFNFTPQSEQKDKNNNEEYWLKDIKARIENAKPFAFRPSDAVCLRREMRDLIYNLHKLFVPINTKIQLLSAPSLTFCNQCLPNDPQIFSTDKYRIGRVSLATMAYLMGIKAKLNVNEFLGLSTAKSRNVHAGKFFYFAEKTQLGDWTQNKIWKDVGIDNFNRLIQAATSPLPMGEGKYLADPGAVLTVKPFAQPPHRDMQGFDRKDDWQQSYFPFILHLPLCEEGMFLNVWHMPHDESVAPYQLHIPFGTFVLLRVDVVHGGVLGSPGNVRLHVAFRTKKSAIETDLKDTDRGADDKKSCIALGIEGNLQSKDRALDKVLQAFDPMERVENHQGKVVGIIPADLKYASKLKKNFPDVAELLGVFDVKTGTIVKN